VLDALSGLCRGPEGGLVTEVLRRCAPHWLAQLPGLLNDEQIKALHPRLAGASTSRMLREFGDAVSELSRDRLLLLVLEDLHDGDHATARLISYLARRREAACLLVLGSYRPAEIIAGDFERGQDYSSAVVQHCAAAVTALGRSAYPEALRHANRVLGLLDLLPEPGQRAWQELEARRAQGVAAAATWGWREPRTVEHCLRLRALAAS
jgi:hypothetical protein